MHVGPTIRVNSDGKGAALAPGDRKSNSNAGLTIPNSPDTPTAATTMATTSGTQRITPDQYSIHVAARGLEFLAHSSLRHHYGDMPHDSDRYPGLLRVSCHA